MAVAPFWWGRCTTHFSGDWHVHWGYGLLTHGHLAPAKPANTLGAKEGCGSRGCRRVWIGSRLLLLKPSRKICRTETSVQVPGWTFVERGYGIIKKGRRVARCPQVEFLQIYEIRLCPWLKRGGQISYFSRDRFNIQGGKSITGLSKSKPAAASLRCLCCNSLTPSEYARHFGCRACETMKAHFLSSTLSFLGLDHF